MKKPVLFALLAVAGVVFMVSRDGSKSNAARSSGEKKTFNSLFELGFDHAAQSVNDLKRSKVVKKLRRAFA